jgi:hypothetical protein
VIPLIYDAFNKREMKRVEEKELELPEGMI